MTLGLIMLLFGLALVWSGVKDRNPFTTMRDYFSGDREAFV